eukprot:scaffold76305_cov20-Tisochrysis_lutea.AAC.2
MQRGSSPSSSSTAGLGRQRKQRKSLRQPKRPRAIRTLTQQAHKKPQAYLLLPLSPPQTYQGLPLVPPCLVVERLSFCVACTPGWLVPECDCACTGAHIPAPAPVLEHTVGAALLSAGFLVAVAHVRGGGHFGPAWHEAGKGLLKQ